jgi:eukaryotic-like serine/threonine-protein kinase
MPAIQSEGSKAVAALSPRPVDPDRFRKAEEVFHQALENSDPAQRDAFLTSACAGDPDLLLMVRGLLDSREAADGAFASEPRFSPLVEKMAASPLIGKYAGPYRLESVLGEGGSGVVLLGRRSSDGCEHIAAVKLVRLTFASEHLIQRFTEERRILARLEHPNVARFLDGGFMADGTPFLVLERIEGEPLHAWTRARNASLSECIELMRKICAAVEYMHENLIVHRDLKPANILVTPQGEPKILDFGAARLLESAELSGVTRTNFPMMTLRYASPEQLRGLAGSTRSDVYSLGVILFELLTGQWPYGQEPVSEVDRIHTVLESEPRANPATPSGKRLDSDITSILFKALEKDPARRYGSAAQLSGDLQRYLAGEPVLARSAGSFYRVGKFVRRHWAAVSAAFVFVLLLAGAAVVSIRQARIAERERATMQEIATFTENLLGASKGMTPIANSGRDLKLVEIIDQASGSVGSKFRDRPEVEAGLQATLAGSYMALGIYDKARPHVERALAIALPLHGESHPLSARVLKLRGRLLMADGKFEEAAADLRKGLSVSPDAFTHSYLGEALWRLGRPGDARSHFDQAHQGMLAEFGPDHTTTATMVNNMGVMEDDLGDYASAEKRFAQAAEVLRRQPGPPPLLFYPLMGIQRAHMFRGEFQQARVVAEEAVAVARKGGDDSRNAASGWSALAMVKAHLRESDAESMSRDAIARARRAFPENHIEIARLLSNHGRVLLLQRNRWKEAEDACRESLAIARKRYPKPNWRTAEAASLTGLAIVLQGSPERRAEGLRLLEEGHREAASVLPAHHPRVVELRAFLETRTYPARATER